MPVHRLRALVLGVIGCALACFAVRAAELPAILTNVQQVVEHRSMLATQVVNVELRGVVTYQNSKRLHFYLQDSTSGIVVNVSPEDCPEFEEEVAISGTTLWSHNQLGIVASEVRKMGRGALPVAKKISTTDASAVRQFAQWVEVEGVVLQARRHVQGSLGLHIADGRDWTVVVVSEMPAGWTVESAYGAHVRIRGVNTGPAASSIVSARGSLVEMVREGRKDLFRTVTTNAGALWRGGVSSGERLKLVGTVLDTTRSGTVFIRDAGAPRGEIGTAFQADYLYPYAAKDGDWIAPAPAKLPKLNRGDVLELVGSPSAHDGFLRMRYCVFRVLRSGEEPEPVRVDLAAVASGQAANNLVTTRGQLVGYTRAQAGGHWYETLRLEDGGRFIDAVLESTSSNQLATLRHDDLVEVTGIAWPQQTMPQVRLRNLRDARSLGIAPAVLKQRTWQGVGAGVVLLGAVGTWFVILRNRAAREHAEAARTRELNVMLEQRVGERTRELEQAREELKRALQQERELGELKSRFVALVSHEFRTPLGITMSAVELIRNYADRLPPEKLQELLQDIYSSTLRMSGLMEQVLLLGRVEAGRIGYQRTPVDLAGLGDRLVDETLSATNRRCVVTFRAEGDLDGANGDESLIRHIVTNLLTNAVKYSPEGSSVAFSARRDGEDAVLVVRDNGIGIPAADRPRIFEAFHRASNVGQTPGTGLGLLIVKRCVDLHGGFIEVESTEGKGTTFTVRLPLWTAKPERLALANN